MLYWVSICTVIQGTADVDKHLSQGELARTIEFCTHVFEPTLPSERDAVLAKLKSRANAYKSGTGPVLVDATNAAVAGPIGTGMNGPGKYSAIKLEAFNAELTTEEQRILDQLKAR